MSLYVFCPLLPSPPLSSPLSSLFLSSPFSPLPYPLLSSLSRCHCSPTCQGVSGLHCIVGHSGLQVTIVVTKGAVKLTGWGGKRGEMVEDGIHCVQGMRRLERELHSLGAYVNRCLCRSLTLAIFMHVNKHIQACQQKWSVLQNTYGLPSRMHRY